MSLEKFSKIELSKKLDTNVNKFDPGKKIEPMKNLDSSRLKSEVYDPGKKLEIKEELFPPLKERYDHTPQSGGEWTGTRGESKFIPDSEVAKEKLNEYGINGIEYKDCVPDFSKVAKETVSIDKMTSERGVNFRQCDLKCAEKWNQEGHDGRSDWKAREVETWRKGNEYSWHEGIDMKTCELVPRAIHDVCKHLGGVGACKRLDGDVEGGKFDVE